MAATALERKALIPKYSQDWKSYKNTATYAITDSQSDLSRLNAELLNISNEVNKSVDEKYIFSAQNLDEITPWNPEIQNDFHAGENWTGIITWAFLALALTLLAAFNYTALSVAKILSRAKEVGIRKTNGALRKQIFMQFVIESVMLSVIALLIAYLTLLILYHSGSMNLDKEINVFPDIEFLFLLLTYTLLTGFIAGAIPAIVLSGFKPIDVLKNLKNLRLVRRINLYRVIIVIQFSITIMLMIFFVILKDIGSNVQDSLITRLPENVTVVDMKNKSANLLISEIQRFSQVKKISLSDYLPVSNPVERCTLSIAGSAAKTIVSTAFIDQNFVNVFNLKLVAGTNVKDDKTSAAGQCALVNESAGHLLKNGKSGLNDVIGQIVSLDSANVEITGILSDDSFPSQNVVPSIFRFDDRKARFISIQGTTGSDDQIKSFCNNLWTMYFPDIIPEIYTFKERNLAEYQSEMGKVNLSFGALCGIVMFVSCLGIFGMANFSVQSNTMQIGIRKTFGATKRQVITSITKPFIIILFISGLIGIPLGWLCGSLLKTRFGANVDLGITNLFTGFTIVMTIALIVVVSQTFQSAKIDPAKVLRGE